MIFLGHYVYKYVCDGEIVYIGKNDTDLETRINQHKLEEKFKPYLKSDIYYIELANSIMSDVVESELIRRYKPKLNVAKMSDWSGLEFTEPEWKIFISTPKKRTSSTKRSYKKSYSDISSKRQRKLKTYKLMSQYYCTKILENISNVKEDELFYEIEVPASIEDSEHKYCVPPYIEFENEKAYGGLSLGCCYSNDGTNVVYRFRKSNVFEEFGDIETGLIPRIKYMQNMFKETLKEISI